MGLPPDTIFVLEGDHVVSLKLPRGARTTSLPLQVVLALRQAYMDLELHTEANHASFGGEVAQTRRTTALSA